MMRGRPAVYATLSSYDEVAHHSGLERADTLEALRKLDQQFARIARARRFAPRPYKLVVLSDHGQTQGATFKQRNGYDLSELVAALDRARDGHRRRPGRRERGDGRSRGQRSDRLRSRGQARRSDRRAARGRAGSGNLGLIYLMEERRRLTMEEIDERHPQTASGAARASAHRLPARPLQRARSGRAGRARRQLPVTRGASRARTRWPRFRPTPPAHLLRTDAFEHVADIMVNSFYDPELEQGCAFEELISFHGGLGGPADPAVHPASGRAAGAGRADRRCGRGP